MWLQNFLKTSRRSFRRQLDSRRCIKTTWYLWRFFFRSLFCSTASRNITFSYKVPQETYTVWTEKSDQLCCTKNSGYWTKELSNISTLTQLLKTFLFYFGFRLFASRLLFLNCFICAFVLPRQTLFVTNWKRTLR